MTSKKLKKPTLPGVAGSADGHLIKRTRLDIPHGRMQTFRSQPKSPGSR